jgi:hypothetical protein
MTILLAALAVVFATFCVWLAMRLTNRHAPRAKWQVLAVLLVLLVWAASFQYELFAPKSAPPAAAWRERVSVEDTEPLQNVPEAISTELREGGLAVTVANRGSTTLGYYAYGPSTFNCFRSLKTTRNGIQRAGTGVVPDYPNTG